MDSVKEKNKEEFKEVKNLAKASIGYSAKILGGAPSSNPIMRAVYEIAKRAGLTD